VRVMGGELGKEAAGMIGRKGGGKRKGNGNRRGIELYVLTRTKKLTIPGGPVRKSVSGKLTPAGDCPDRRKSSGCDWN